MGWILFWLFVFIIVSKLIEVIIRDFIDDIESTIKYVYKKSDVDEFGCVVFVDKFGNLIRIKDKNRYSKIPSGFTNLEIKFGCKTIYAYGRYEPWVSLKIKLHIYRLLNDRLKFEESCVRRADKIRRKEIEDKLK